MWYLQSFFSLIAYTGQNCESEIVVCRNTTCLNNGTYSSELTSDREINKDCYCSAEYGGDLCKFNLICTLHKWISVWWCRVETKLHCWVISVNTSLAMLETNVLDLYENIHKHIFMYCKPKMFTTFVWLVCKNKSVFDQYYLYNPHQTFGGSS